MAIGFLHTAPEHTATFDRLLVERGGLGAQRAHVVVPHLLRDAMERGIDDEAVRSGLVASMLSFPEGVDRIIVTCSTLGGVAEELAPAGGPLVTRVDRPMAEAAVTRGSRIGVVYALDATVVPTSALLWEVANTAGRNIDLDLIDCPSAWKRFEAGDHERYLELVAEAVTRRAHDIDVAVLAQASMAGAAELLGDLGIPVLSSPVLAVEAALAGS